MLPDVTSVFESRDFKSSVGFRSNSRFSESDRFREAGAISGRKLGGDVVDDSVVGETNDGAMEPAYGFLMLSKAKESLASESMEVPVNRGYGWRAPRRRGSSATMEMQEDESASGVTINFSSTHVRSKMDVSDGLEGVALLNCCRCC